MLYQNLLASDDERLGRRILEAEETAYARWATETERIAGVLEIDVGEEHSLIKNA